jgi:pimeloyl-ACP methyl ester carboxylesterase
VTVVLVHGNPETDAIWGPLVDALGRDDVVRLSPPGFGAPLPEDFPATHTAYRDWLIGELEAIAGPIDLVGHDWGGGHVILAVLHRPELVRTWVSDVIGLFDPDYVWHDLAQVWQTPGAGEELVAQMSSGPIDERAAQLSALGIPLDIATELAAAHDDQMSDAILKVYRSAAQPVLADIGRDLDPLRTRPGMVILATEDTFVGTDDMRRRTGERAGARVEVLDGLGHWWMLEDPQRAAAALTTFWASY